MSFDNDGAALTVIDEIFRLFESKGKTSYLGEPVSQLQHALQAANCALREHAPAHLVVAALLHDVGHLVEDLPEDIAGRGIDAKHEEIGHEWLSKRFGPEVYEPVRLHVAAKRYLCATDPEYLAKLSAASIQSLRLQGGPMTKSDIRAFETSPFFRDAVQLRHWDDLAKVKDLETPGLEEFRGCLESAILNVAP